MTHITNFLTYLPFLLHSILFYLIVLIYSSNYLDLFSALGRPTLFPLPGVVAKAIFGEFGDEVLLGE